MRARAGNTPCGRPLRTELAVEYENSLALGRRALARAGRRRPRAVEEARLDVGELRQVDGPLDVAALVLIVEAAVDNDELFDAVAVQTALQLVQLR